MWAATCYDTLFYRLFILVMFSFYLVFIFSFTGWGWNGFLQFRFFLLTRRKRYECLHCWVVIIFYFSILSRYLGTGPALAVYFVVTSLLMFFIYAYIHWVGIGGWGDICMGWLKETPRWSGVHCWVSYTEYIWSYLIFIFMYWLHPVRSFWFFFVDTVGLGLNRTNFLLSFTQEL
jgi:hypothetical protein